MTLVGYRAANHPQQIRRRGPRPEIDDRATAPEVFDPINAHYRFTLDVAASASNAKCARYYTPAENGLSQSWAGQRVWCNPPYSNIGPWVAKAWREWNAGAEVIVMLLPANRTEQRWWQVHIEPARDRGGPLRVTFLAGRPRFIRLGAAQVGPNERPPFGCCLLTWESSRPPSTP